MELVRLCLGCSRSDMYYAKGLCRYCYNKQFRQKNLDHVRAREAGYRAADPEKYRIRDRARHERDKPKRNALCRNYRKNNLEYLKAYDYARSRTEARRKYSKALKAKNIDRTREVDRQRYYRDKPKRIALVNQRRANKGKATPKWLSDTHRQEIYDIYANRPEGHHVDHIVPIQGKTVCGLHVPWNLQYLPAAESIRKGNKLVPDKS